MGRQINYAIRCFCILLYVCYNSLLCTQKPIFKVDTHRLLPVQTAKRDTMLITYLPVGDTKQKFCSLSLPKLTLIDQCLAVSVNEFIPDSVVSWQDVYVSNAQTNNNNLYVTLCPNIAECAIYETPIKFIGNGSPKRAGKIKRFATGSEFSCDKNNANCFIVVNGEIDVDTQILQLTDRAPIKIKHADHPLVADGYLYFTTLSETNFEPQGISRISISSPLRVEPLTNGYDVQAIQTAVQHIAFLRKSSAMDKENFDLVFLDTKRKKIVLKLRVPIPVSENLRTIQILPHKNSLAVVTNILQPNAQLNYNQPKTQSEQAHEYLRVYSFLELCTSNSCKKFFATY